MRSPKSTRRVVSDLAQADPPECFCAKVFLCQGVSVAETANPSDLRFSGLECVVNISEGRRRDILETLARSLDSKTLLDLHIDPWHHRSVWTLLGIEAPRQLARRAIELLHLDQHHGGVHPRLGVVDVVPFVPLGSATMLHAITARDDFARWASFELGVPSFLYGPTITKAGLSRTLPEIRRRAFKDLHPDWGSDSPHISAGAICVGARQPLVAFNIWLRPGSNWSRATEITASLRSPEVRALTLRVDSQIQISMNLVEPLVVGPADVYDTVRSETERTHGKSRNVEIDRAELVGLVPGEVLNAIPLAERSRLDLSQERTIEYRIENGFQFTTLD